LSIYTDLKEAGVRIESHASDLYCPDTPLTRHIIERNGRKIDGWNVKRFLSGKDVWLDVAFAYEPYWESKEVKR
jgi:hypothetical protein